ncbi:hypothetical protein [Agromyces sp. Marseille-Q5079]|uniref:hypothetical protein n=1 Tax=Agromyces sp. Marseille-Q5079 TaxID=3439059 RepID=UPI003D9C9EC2
MSEMDDVLNEVRAEESSRRPRGRLALLIVAGIAAVAAISGATVLTVSATAGITAFEAQNSAPSPEAGSEPASGTVADIVAVPAAAEPTAPAESGSDAAADATTEEPVADDSDGAPVFDASTDVSTIPAPPADWPESEVLNARIWLQQQDIVADCMLEQGFTYEYTPFWLLTADDLPSGSSGDGGPGSAEWVALWGPDDQPLGEDYDWQQAGCHGYAVHVTGMDDAN